MVFVLGFGRSGTTWVSDIISKCKRGLLLFEPLHPSVNVEMSYKYAYSLEPDDKLKKYFDNILEKQIKKDWLLRNHVPDRLEKTSEKIKKDIWENCDIYGIKSIRTNFMMDWIYENYGAKIIYLKRDIFSVVSSIIKRNFWEFGWPETYNIFINKVKYYIDYIEYDDYISKIASMWCITFILTKNNKALNVFYEDLFLNPFSEAKKILEHIEYKNNIHPSFIFTPSNTSLMKISNYAYEKDLSKFVNLDRKSIDKINKVLQDYNIENYYEKNMYFRQNHK